MNLWNAKKLALRLRDGQVSQRECLYYFLIYMVGAMLFTTSVFIHWLEISSLNRWDIACDIFLVFSTFLGTIAVYSINEKGDNQAFIGRFMCLSVPAFIQTIVLAIGVMALTIMIYIMFGMPASDSPDETDAFGFFFSSILIIYYYYRLYRAIGFMHS